MLVTMGSPVALSSTCPQWHEAVLLIIACLDMAKLRSFAGIFLTPVSLVGRLPPYAVDPVSHGRVTTPLLPVTRGSSRAGQSGRLRRRGARSPIGEHKFVQICDSDSQVPGRCSCISRTDHAFALQGFGSGIALRIGMLTDQLWSPRCGGEKYTTRGEAREC